MVDEISNIFVKPLTGCGNLKAIATLNYKGVILKGLKLLEKDNTLWLGMPARKRDEQWEDIYFFPDALIRKRILDAVVEKYHAEKGD